MYVDLHQREVKYACLRLIYVYEIGKYTFTWVYKTGQMINVEDKSE